MGQVINFPSRSEKTANKNVSADTPQHANGDAQCHNNEAREPPHPRPDQ